MDDTNKHIDNLFSQKANAHKADMHFAKIDFEAIIANLPTAPAFDLIPKTKPTNWFGLNTIVVAIGIVGVIGFIFLWNKGSFSKSENNNTSIESKNALIEGDTLQYSTNQIIKDTSKDISTISKQVKDNTAINLHDLNKTSIQKRSIIQPNIVKTVTINTNDAQENILATQNFFSTLSNASQLFNIDASKDTFIICKDGTALAIKANSFTNKNKTLVKGMVQLEIKEAYNFTEVIANGLHTVSNSNLLETRGMVFMNASQGDSKLDINIRNPIQISLPNNNKKTKMQLFYLDKSANDDLLNTKTNWIANEQLQDKNHAFQIRNFGWLNCSQFIKENIEKVNIKIELQNEKDSDAIRAMLIFPKMKSVINLYYKNGSLVQQNLPLGKDAYLVSFKIKNGKPLSLIQKITIIKEIIQAEEYKDIPTAQVKAELDAIGKLP
jgi:hypothetical protein